MRTQRKKQTVFSGMLSVCPFLLSVGIAIKGAAVDRAFLGEPWQVIVLCTVGMALAVTGIALLRVSRRRRKGETKDATTGVNSSKFREAEVKNTNELPQLPMVQIAKIHNIGCRPNQQDSLGVAGLSDGVFAVVADGMGGLAAGDEVSQCVVTSMLKEAATLTPGQMDGAMDGMVQNVNEAVNTLLGPQRIYQSGSTMVAVLVRNGFFHWASVGDSRIYLYRGGRLFQLNQEHTYEVELRQRVMRGEITRAEADTDPQRRGLTSFFGMGRLRYVDISIKPIRLEVGDKLLLMTDGIFNKLTDETMAGLINADPDVEQVAVTLEKRVANLHDPSQDNFTAVILGW